MLMNEMYEEFASPCGVWNILCTNGILLSEHFYNASVSMESRGIRDVHFECRAKDGGILRVYYGKPRVDYARMGGDECSSCHPELPLSVLLKVLPRSDGKVDPLSEIPNSALMLKSSVSSRVWIDGKGRPLLVATPLKHVERITELTREESIALWNDLCAVLQEVLPKEGQSTKSAVKSFVVNHGSRQVKRPGICVFECRIVPLNTGFQYSV